MLTVKKTMNLSGESVVNEKRVIYLNAAISEDNNSNSNISQHIEDQQLYLQNKDECRKDIDEFTKQVREIEDTMNN